MIETRSGIQRAIRGFRILFRGGRNDKEVFFCDHFGADPIAELLDLFSDITKESVA